MDSAKHGRCSPLPHLAVVPGPLSDLKLCAVVDPTDVVEDELLPLLLGVQENSVIWESK